MTSSVLTFMSQGSQKKKRNRNVLKNVFDEIMAENFPNLEKETDIQFKEAQ